MLGKILSFRLFSILFVLGLISQVIGFADNNTSTVSASASAFVVRYCTHDNYTWDPLDTKEWYLFVYSNGTATAQLAFGSRYGSSTMDYASHLSDDLISEVYETMTNEGFMSLGPTHDDPGWPLTWSNHTERVCLEVSNESKTATFNGNSMMGIIPKSFAILNNVRSVVTMGVADIPDANLDIEVIEQVDQGPIAEIEVDLTNNGETVLSDAGLCAGSWPLYVVRSDGRTVDDLQKGMAPNCSMEFQPHTTTDFGPWEWNRTGLSPGKYVIMSRVAIWDYEIGNIDSSSTWTPVDNHAEPSNHYESIFLALVGVGIVLAVGVASFYVFRIRQEER